MTTQELYDIAEKEDIRVDDFDLSSCEALSICLNKKCYIAIDRNKIRSTADETEKLAHELGHCMRGAFYNERSRYELVSRMEHRANVWAIKKLIPKDELIRLLKENYSLYDIADIFCVTEKFIRFALEYYRKGK